MQDTLTSYKRALKKLTGLEGEELDNAARDLFEAYLLTRPQIKQIKTLRNSYKSQTAFFPRTREQGRFRLKVVETIFNEEGMPVGQKQHYMAMFDRSSQADEILSNIKKRYMKDGSLPENWSIVPEKVLATPEQAYHGVNDINVQRILDNALAGMTVKESYFDEKGNKIDIQDAIRDAGYQAVATEFQKRGFGRHMIHRQAGLVKGYQETGLQDILLSYITGMSGIMSKQVAAADFLDSMKDVTDPAMWKSLEKYGRDQLRNDTKYDRISNKTRSFMFAWYIGGVLRPALVQLTQNFVTGMPKHAQFLRNHNMGGFGVADKQYAKAMADVARGKLTVAEKKLEEQLFISGVTADQYIRDIYSGLGSDFGQKYRKAFELMAIPFSRMEQFNRQSAALCRFRPAYQIAMKKVGKNGFTEEDAYNEAFESARDFVYDTHYAMGKANLPQIAQGEGAGTLFKTLYTFRSFTHNFVLQTFNDLSKGDFRTVMHSMAYIAIFGGLMGLPFMKDLFEYLEKEYGWSFTKSIRQTLNSVGGDTLETFGVHGLPAMLGGNISGSLAIGIPFMGETPADSIFGVYGGQKQKLTRAAESALRGDWNRVATNIAPEFLRGPLTAAIESKAGKEFFGLPGYVTTTRGRPVFGSTGEPISMTSGEAFVRAGLGMQPTRYAKEKEMERSVQRIEAWAADKKARAAERYRIAKINNEPDAMKDLMKAVKDINQGIKSRGLQRLVPPASLSKIIQSSRQIKHLQEKREIAYKTS